MNNLPTNQKNIPVYYFGQGRKYLGVEEFDKFLENLNSKDINDNNSEY